MERSKKLLLELKQLETPVLVGIILAYSDYVQEYEDRINDGGYPVSFLEWYDNDYKEVTED